MTNGDPNAPKAKRVTAALALCLAMTIESWGQDGKDQHGRAPAKRSSELRVALPGRNVTLSIAAIEALPQSSVTVHNAHTNADERYTGAKLTDVLAKAGAKAGKDVLHSYVIASGADGYWVLYSGEEISDTVHTGEVIVATEREGKPLSEDGALKLVSTEDRKPERWVRNLEAISWRLAAN